MINQSQTIMDITLFFFLFYNVFLTLHLSHYPEIGISEVGLIEVSARGQWVMGCGVQWEVHICQDDER